MGVPKEYGLNTLFKLLTERNIKVISLKNRTNRLEQLFMDLIDQESDESLQ